MRVVMLDLQTAQTFGWDVSIFLRAFLFCLLVYRKNLRLFPFFAAYLLMNIAKAVILVLMYKAWGFGAYSTYLVAWTAEGLVTCARALAVAELCRLMLGAYRGIWSLASRVLLSCAGLIIVLAAITAAPTLEAVIIEAHRASELAIASVIVVLFLFLRHYEVISQPALRVLAVGFCVFACLAVINVSILKQFTNSYAIIWNTLGVYTYMACLLAWIWVLRETVLLPAGVPMLFSRAVYQRISPEMNAQLRALNERLSQFWEAEAPRP
jgi:hypothetical protein